MSGRGWAGTTLAGRRADRHQRLLDVGLELLGTQGSAAVSVRSVCRAAQLTDRYFYESFADREALVRTVYDGVAAQAREVLIAAGAGCGSEEPHRVATAAVEAFVELITADPRKGRVLLLEPQSDPALNVRGAAVVPAFEEIIRAQLGDSDAIDSRLTAAALVGALANLFVRWLDGTLAVERAVLTQYCVRLLVASRELVEPLSSASRTGRAGVALRADRRRHGGRR